MGSAAAEREKKRWKENQNFRLYFLLPCFLRGTVTKGNTLNAKHFRFSIHFPVLCIRRQPDLSRVDFLSFAFFSSFPSIRRSILCVLVVPRCEFRALTLNITKEHNRFEIENLLHAIEAINFISAFFLQSENLFDSFSSSRAHIRQHNSLLQRPAMAWRRENLLNIEESWRRDFLRLIV